MALSSPTVQVARARKEMTMALMPHFHLRPGTEQRMGPRISAMLRFSTQMLCFWLRGGALYEPTLALGTLLGGSDIGQDLPLQYLAPPLSTMCVLPPWQQRHHCADSAAIMVFQQEAEPLQAPARRVLTLMSYHGSSASDLQVDEMALPVKSEGGSICEALLDACANAGGNLSANGFADADSLDASHAKWERVLDYLAKILLYLQLDQHALRHVQAYSAAPKEFPGLGRRKREARLAQVEQLYDRYIIGPDTLSDAPGTTGGAGLRRGHELPAHWRRGHFRLQAHGPHMSLRKVMFIPPTVVRADRLGAIPVGAVDTP